MSMDSSGEQDAGERRTGPTVTRDRWVNHARQKLARGYVLIVSNTRKNANFYSPQKGYEMCAFDVARKLIVEGLVEKTRKHHLGDVYELSGPLPAPVPAARRADDDDDEVGPSDEFVADLDAEEDVESDDDLDDDDASVDEFADEEEENEERDDEEDDFRD